ncbi:zinc-dependent dehydrogenase [Oceanobacillus jeddahense]|uniref:zinc-dependent dehydrogenase n=1 Tax=Oceanobacillus jeddahense TaxID=1462527 RepID=UPI00059589B4|nr:Zn-dependent alcohol dehydrogenase [Oceanobacillus jeddahense]
MLSAKMYDKENIEVIKEEIPAISEDEILLKVKSAGICGTDLRIYRNGHPEIHKDSPRTLGHEFSGVIEKVGSSVDGYKKGMRVAAAPNIGCGKCDICVSGNQHLCKEYKAIGVQLDGAFAEYLKIPAKAINSGNISELPDHVSFEEASIIEPLACVYSGIEKCEIKPGDDVLIIGAGPIGIMHAMLAKISGAANVFISNRSTNRLEMAKEIDNSFITIPNSDLKREIDLQTNGEGVDVCITACSSADAQTLSLELVKLNGRISFFGGLPKGKEKVELDTNLIHYKQLTILGTTKASNEQFRKTLHFISSGLLDVKKLTTGKYHLNDIHDAFEEAMSGKGLKTVIVYD